MLNLPIINRHPGVALADLGGRAWRMPPLWDPILSFLHTFSLKSAHIGGPRPPLREILDAPLGSDHAYLLTHKTIYLALIIGRSRGGHARCTPPYGTKFFYFRIHFCQKAPMSEVHTPPKGSTAPLWEILDPPLLSD